MDEVRDEIPEASSRPVSMRVKSIRLSKPILEEVTVVPIELPVEVPVVPVEVPVVPVEVTVVPVEVPVEVPVVPVEVPVVPVVVRSKTEINIEKVSRVMLIDFDISNIVIIPQKSATVKVIINSSTGPLVRTVHIAGEDYAKWSGDDDYVYYYIQRNIDDIYNN